MTVPDEAVMATMPPGSVVITPTQMYAEIRAMGGKLDHLAAVVDPALTTIREDVAEVRVTLTDHETRLRGLDRRIWLMAVAAAASGAGIAQVTASFVN